MRLLLHLLHVALVQLASLPIVLSVTPIKARDATIPQYVYDYAPLVWLHSQDPYKPSDLQIQLDKTTPQKNWTVLAEAPSPLNLSNLNRLNDLGNTSVYLTSREGIAAKPEPTWFHGITPDEDGRTGNGTACAIIVVDHGKEAVDAFYFYFYAYNKGDKVLGLEFGDHIGDWEHNMIRFSKGSPQAVWFSQHSSGQAFAYHALEKEGKRPYAYSGNGTHANYAIAGSHDHTIPGVNLPTGFLVDYTDRGKLWDPTLNAYSYVYDPSTATFTSGPGEFPVSWLYFNGRWGDDKPPNEPTIFGQARYMAGPDGPQFKDLNRNSSIPQLGDECDFAGDSSGGGLN
ncbi:hypothetical protein N7495_009557 [Penicillium taxi]|uniref:uncharacterized protein n=1 Tax=Penicillium taxi TaxID=168475 RepID=UPI0025458D1C|nr:uncharacterized protein N7495_009557 [Penicillium taxi]KAJ5885047.1 hypothetical protein N7495_009557 [Penicillium taxi]